MVLVAEREREREVARIKIIDYNQTGQKGFFLLKHTVFTSDLFN